MLDDFKIRDGKIYLTTLFRSHNFGELIRQTFKGSPESLNTWGQQGGNRTLNDYYY
jgi:hypothetical protein